MKIIEQGVCGNRRRSHNPPFNGRYIAPLPDCPLCHGNRTCDMWTAEVDDNWSPEYPKPVWSEEMVSSSIDRSEYDVSDVNVFPGNIVTNHEDVLFIFLDNPTISRKDVFDYVNKRIRDHIRGAPTEVLRLVTQDEDSLFDFFGWNMNRRTKALSKRWREVDSTFAPTISFENYNGDSI